MAGVLARQPSAIELIPPQHTCHHEKNSSNNERLAIFNGKRVERGSVEENELEEFLVRIVNRILESTPEGNQETTTNGIDAIMEQDYDEDKQKSTTLGWW